MLEHLETPIPLNSPIFTKALLNQTPEAEIQPEQRKSRKSTAESEYIIFLIAESSDEEESDTEENKTLASFDDANSEATF